MAANLVMVALGIALTGLAGGGLRRLGGLERAVAPVPAAARIGMTRWREPSSATMPPHMPAQCTPPNRPSRNTDVRDRPSMEARSSFAGVDRR